MSASYKGLLHEENINNN